MSLEGRLNGIVVEGPTVINKAHFKVGDQLELTCSANVGSIPSTVIQWRSTSEIGQVDNFIEYNPPFGTVSETDPVKDACAYTRTATIRYNMTMADANRQNNLGFECYVRLTTPPYNNYETTDNKRFYAEVWAPAAPYDIHIDSVQQTSVTLSWQPSFHGGVDQTVVIQISTDGIFWINKTVLFLGQNIQRTTVTLQDLYSSRSYYLRMFSYNIQGKSNLTKIFNFTTLGKEEKEVSSSKSLIGGVAGGVAGAVFIAAVVLIIVYLKKREFNRKDNKEPEDMTERSPQCEYLEGRPERNEVAEYSFLTEAVQLEESPANYYNSPDRKPYQNLQTSQT